MRITFSCLIALCLLLFFSLTSQCQEDDIGSDGSIGTILNYKRMKLDIRGADAICFIIDRSPSMEDDIEEIEEYIENMLGKPSSTLNLSPLLPMPIPLRS